MSLKEKSVQVNLVTNNCFTAAADFNYVVKRQSLFSIVDLAKMAAKYPDSEKLKCYISCSRLRPKLH